MLPQIPEDLSSTISSETSSSYSLLLFWLVMYVHKKLTRLTLMKGLSGCEEYGSTLYMQC